MSLLNNDNAKIISMITEGKIQAAEQTTAKKLNESLQEKAHQEITKGKLEASGMKRIKRAEGGVSMLDDDRQRYANGKKISEMTDEEYERQEEKELAEYEKKEALEMEEYEKKEAEEMATFIKENKKPNETEDELFKRIARENEEARKKRLEKAEGGSLLEDDMPNKGLEALEKEVPEVVARMLKAVGGSMMEQPMMEEPMMEEPKEAMLPDEEMENDFIDFILDEALSEEEEDMLMSMLEQNDQLSMLFDKVIDVAQEFAGSGPVEGPGSGVSDSIPARLSDGEFVFTAKAVEEIGADKLMAMMKDAEMKAEERQGLAEGGMPEEEETVTMKVQEQKEPKVQIAKATVDSTRGLLDEDEISKGIKSKMMLDPLQRHVRS